MGSLNLHAERQGNEGTEWEEGMYPPPPAALQGGPWTDCDRNSTSQRDPSMWSSPPKFQHSPSLLSSQYSTWLSSLHALCSLYVQIKVSVTNSVPETYVFPDHSLNSVLNKKRTSPRGYIQSTRWEQKGSRLAGNNEGVREGWWVALCTKGTTGLETCWSFPLSQSPLLPKLVWVPD